MVPNDGEPQLSCWPDLRTLGSLTACPPWWWSCGCDDEHFTSAFGFSALLRFVWPRFALHLVHNRRVRIPPYRCAWLLKTSLPMLHPSPGAAHIQSCQNHLCIDIRRRKVYVNIFKVSIAGDLAVVRSNAICHLSGIAAPLSAVVRYS